MPTSEPPAHPAERMPLDRSAVRAFIVSSEGEVLLLRIRSPEGLVLWIAPGGGIEPGEAIDAALKRELEEEVGLVDCEIGPMIWRRKASFDWGPWRVTQSEDYHVVHAERFEPVMTDPHEAEITEAFRWWPLAALSETNEMIVPVALATILQDYLRDGPPQHPLEVEVVID